MFLHEIVILCLIGLARGLKAARCRALVAPREVREVAAAEGAGSCKVPGFPSFVSPVLSSLLSFSFPSFRCISPSVPSATSLPLQFLPVLPAFSQHFLSFPFTSFQPLHSQSFPFLAYTFQHFPSDNSLSFLSFPCISGPFTSLYFSFPQSPLRACSFYFPSPAFTSYHVPSFSLVCSFLPPRFPNPFILRRPHG